MASNHKMDAYTLHRNLSGNNLSGSIPQTLLNMQKNGLTLLYVSFFPNQNFLWIFNPPFIYIFSIIESKIVTLWEFNSLQGNPNLCLDPSCEKEADHENNNKKLLVPILASAASGGIITAVLLLVILLFRKKRPSEGKLND